MLIVVGIVGPIASGKDTVLEELEKLGFKAFFLGERTREEADRRGLPHDRSVLQDMGNDLREKFGDDILVKRTEELFDGSEEKIVIDGIRNAGEVAYLRKKYNTIIIGVDAPSKKRREFSRKRSADADPKTGEEFKRVEQRDRGIGENSHGQQVEECLRESDIVIENSSTEKDFIKKIKRTLIRFNL
ncbi:MAG: AAA family ATPase [Candidatus Levybacteria bacterium]|nr:AAA family ATPase [Candidatus Levybacteria bacterium]